MDGKGKPVPIVFRSACYLQIAALLFLFQAFFSNPLLGAESKSKDIGTPLNYTRAFDIYVADGHENPLSGVLARITPMNGMPVGETSAMTDDSGHVLFRVEYLTENLTTGPDRLWKYQATLTWDLSKPAHVTRTGRLEDNQEYASYADPLYQGLDRRPERRPYALTIELPAIRDFLLYPDRTAAESLGALPLLIGRFVDGNPDFRLLPGSVHLTDEGCLHLGLDYDLLFDQSEMGLLMAGDLLLRRPIRDALRIVATAGVRLKAITAYEISVRARFLLKDTPHTMPVKQMLTFRFSESDALGLLKWTPGDQLTMESLEVRVGERPVRLRLGKESRMEVMDDSRSTDQ